MPVHPDHPHQADSPDTRAHAPFNQRAPGQRAAEKLGRLLSLRPGEIGPAAGSAAYFFCILCAYYLLKPIREAFGIRGELSDLPWLWTCTTLAMLIVTPLFAWLVSRVPRRRFMPITYRAFAAMLLVFYALLQVLPPEHHKAVGYIFYVWVSVFNLFLTSIFWGFMADVWSIEQGKRIFATLAVGGTLGAIAGSSAAAMLAPRIGDPSHLIPVSALLLEAAVLCVRVLVRRFGLRAGESSRHAREAAGPPVTSREPSRNVWRGFALLARSPYLMAMSASMMLFTVTSTFLYFEQARIVKATFEDQALRVAAFARIELATNILTLLTQLFVTSRLVRALGLRATLSILPLVSILGFAALALAPSAGWPIFATFAVVQVARRSLNFAVDRPSREMLYTPLGPDEKYKAKSVIDTFLYRLGDLLAAWSTRIPWVTASIEGVAIGVGVLSLMLAFYLSAAFAALTCTPRPAHAPAPAHAPIEA